MLDLLLEIALKSAFVSALALVLVMALRNLAAAQRAWIAHLGLALSLLMPLIVLVGPKLEMTGPWSRVMPAAAAAPPLSAGDVAIAPPPPAQAADASVSLQTGDILLVVYAAIAAALIFALVLGLARLFRLQRDAAVLTEPNWLCALAQAQHRMGLKHGTALLCSPKLAAPVSWGLLRPTIMLSPAALKASDKAEAILAHELAHVARMDWVNLLISRLATALYWFNPIVWVLAWQAHELREEAADDVVLRGEVRGSDYASLLMGFARAGRAPAVVAHGVTPGKDSLRRRLERVLDGDARRDPARPMWIAICAAIALGIAAPVGAFTPVDHTGLGAKSYDGGAIDEALLGGDLTDYDALDYGEAEEAEPGEAAEPAEPAEPAEAAEPGEPAELSGFLRYKTRRGDTVILAQAYERDLEGGRGAMLQGEGRLSPRALAQLRTFDITPQWLDAMEREIPNVRQLSVDEIVGLAALGVTPQYVRSLRDAGYRNLDVEELHGFAAVGVTPQYIASLRQAGYANLDAEELQAFATHEVSPAFIQELAAAGYPNLEAEDIVALRIAGIDAAYIRNMEAAGLRLERRGDIRRLSRSRMRTPPSPPETLPVPQLPN